MKYLIVILLFCKVFVLEGQKIQWGQLQQKLDKHVQISQVIGQNSAKVFTILTDMRSPPVFPPILRCFTTVPMPKYWGNTMYIWGALTCKKRSWNWITGGHVICAGLFNDGFQETLGAFASIIDQKTGEVKTHAGHFIDSELNSLTRVSKRLTNFQFRGLQLSPSGRISLLAEQFLAGQRGNNSHGQVLLLSYPPDLNSRSLINLYKNQVSADYGYFDSYALVAKDEQLVLMYNDKGKSAVFKASLNSSKAEHLTTLGSDKTQICPRACAALPGRALWIYAETEDKKQYQVGLLKP